MTIYLLYGLRNMHLENRIEEEKRSLPSGMSSAHLSSTEYTGKKITSFCSDVARHVLQAFMKVRSDQVRRMLC